MANFDQLDRGLELVLPRCQSFEKIKLIKLPLMLFLYHLLNVRIGVSSVGENSIFENHSLNIIPTEL